MPDRNMANGSHNWNKEIERYRLFRKDRKIEIRNKGKGARLALCINKPDCKEIKAIKKIKEIFGGKNYFGKMVKKASEDLMLVCSLSDPQTDMIRNLYEIMKNYKKEMWDQKDCNGRSKGIVTDKIANSLFYQIFTESMGRTVFLDLVWLECFCSCDGLGNI